MAKPLANGFPIGAIMVRDKIANHITPGPYFSIITLPLFPFPPVLSCPVYVHVHVYARVCVCPGNQYQS